VPSAVLLLHGFPECAEQWEHQLAALAGAGYRAVAFDQRGYSPGVRPAEVGAYGPEQLIGDVLGVADSLGWPRFDLVGHDWGSAVAWMTAAAHSARLRALTTVSTPHGAALVHALRDDPASGAAGRTSSSSAPRARRSASYSTRTGCAGSTTVSPHAGSSATSSASPSMAR
jgi:pimeloyl-ACP methyl ester carboxylesterase